MGRAYSNDLRKRVVRAVENEGMSASAASRRFGVARSTAILWVQRYRQTGDVSASRVGRPKGMKVAAYTKFIMTKMKNKDTTLDILQDALWEECGVYASRTLLHRFIQAEGLSYKKNRARQRAEPA
ncbi:MAG: transposase [Pseudomonadota bacterium]